MCCRGCSWIFPKSFVRKVEVNQRVLEASLFKILGGPALDLSTTKDVAGEVNDKNTNVY